MMFYQSNRAVTKTYRKEKAMNMQTEDWARSRLRRLISPVLSQKHHFEQLIMHRSPVTNTREAEWETKVFGFGVIIRDALKKGGRIWLCCLSLIQATRRKTSPSCREGSKQLNPSLCVVPSASSTTVKPSAPQSHPSSALRTVPGDWAMRTTVTN